MLNSYALNCWGKARKHPLARIGRSLSASMGGGVISDIPFNVFSGGVPAHIPHQL
jgi:hypothetical protein